MPVNMKSSPPTAPRPSVSSSPQTQAPTTTKSTGPAVAEQVPAQKQLSAPTWNQGPDGFGQGRNRAPQTAAPQTAVPQNIRQAATTAAPRGQQMDVQQECAALGNKHGAQCTTSIYQSGRLNGVAISEHPGTSNGVCIGMSSEWIRSNIQDAKAGTNMHMQAFQAMAENKRPDGSMGNINPHFANVQNMGAEDIKRLQAKEAEVHAALKKYDDMKNPSQSWSPWPKPKPTEAAVLQQGQHLVSLHNELKQMKQDHLSSMVGGASKPQETHNNKPFGPLQQSFSSQFPQDGHYQMSIFKPGMTGGHDFAVKMGDKPTLMDPNTGEWQFQSKQQLDNFMKDYTAKLYPGYANGTFNAVHHPY